MLALQINHKFHPLRDFGIDIRIVSYESDDMDKNLLIVQYVDSFVKTVVDRALLEDPKIFYQHARLKLVVHF